MWSFSFSPRLGAQCATFAGFAAGPFLAQAPAGWSAFGEGDPVAADGRIVDGGSGPALQIGPYQPEQVTDLVYTLAAPADAVDLTVRVAAGRIATFGLGALADLGTATGWLVSLGSDDLVNHLRQRDGLGYVYRLRQGGVDTALTFTYDPGEPFTLRIVRSDSTTVHTPAGAEARLPVAFEALNFFTVSPADTYEVLAVCPRQTTATHAPAEAGEAPVATYTRRAGEELPQRYRGAKLLAFDVRGRVFAQADLLGGLAPGYYFVLVEGGESGGARRERWLLLP